MEESALVVPYLVAGVLFILSLGGLSNQETARRGNLFGSVGMVIALIATLFHPKIEIFDDSTALALVLGSVVVGGIIGVVMALRVVMTGMPQLVAILHSFVGLAAVLVGLSTYLGEHPVEEGLSVEAKALLQNVHNVEIWLGVAIGAITFTGSVVAWAKLRGSLSGKPLLLPGRHLLNAVAVIAIFGMMVPFLSESSPETGLTLLLVMINNFEAKCFFKK